MSDKVKLLVSLSAVGIGLVAAGIFVVKKILDSDDCCAPGGCVYNCDDCPFDRESDDCYDDYENDYENDHDDYDYDLE